MIPNNHIQWLPIPSSTKDRKLMLSIDLQHLCIVHTIIVSACLNCQKMYHGTGCRIQKTLATYV